ncbi:hypothetical protein STENM223S_04893 [Streptomyces tendae]
MGRRLLGRQDVVDGDAVGEPVRLAFAEEDDGHVTGRVGQLLRPERPRADDETVDQAPAGAVEQPPLGVGVPEGLVDHDGPRALLGGVHDLAASSPKYGE